MRLQRVPLPGSATIVALPGMLLLDSNLSRDSAALAVVGVLPDLHPDVVEHWLDQAYERHRPRLVRGSAAVVLVAAMLGAPLGTLVHATSSSHRPAWRVVRVV